MIEDTDDPLPLCLRKLRHSAQRLYTTVVGTPFPDVESQPDSSTEATARFLQSLQWFDLVKFAYGDAQHGDGPNGMHERKPDEESVLSHFVNPESRARWRLEIHEGSIRFNEAQPIRAARESGRLIGAADLNRITNNWLITLHPDSRQPQLLTAETILGPLPSRFVMLPVDRAIRLTFGSIRDRGNYDPVMTRADGGRAHRFLGRPDFFSDEVKASLKAQGVVLESSDGPPIEFSPEQWLSTAPDLADARRAISTIALALVQWVQNGLVEVENAVQPFVDLPHRHDRRTVHVRVRMAGAERSVELQSKQVEFLTKLAKNNSATIVRATFLDLIRNRIPELAPFITAMRRSSKTERENESTYQLSPTMKDRIKSSRKHD